MTVLEQSPGAHSVSELFLQSDVIPGGNSGAPDMQVIKQDLLTFHDSTMSNMGGVQAPIAPISSADQTASGDLDKFFSRPVRVGNFTWNESDAVGTLNTINPWHKYFTDARVQYKLNNYAFIQCKLKIKVLINASPFYYGSMYCGYQPLQAFTPSTIVNDTGTRYLIPYSQRPCVWLTPQRNEGAEMDLPMFYQQNWINAQNQSSFSNLGQLSFINYTTLQSANGVTGSGVTVTVYAWAEDVKLSGPSVGLATQSDEYGKGVVSQAASAIAATASTLTRVPFIGRFATATTIGAKALSGIASLFGFTNVPVIEDTRPFRPEPFPKFASSEIGYPVEKLTLDPKNELTLDSGVAGIPAEDQLVISHLVQRESYLCTTTWTTAQAADTFLFSTPVSPAGLLDTDGAIYAKWYLTPPAWVAAMFQNWRGDIIFRFRIVASQFHKGRLRISFDPSGSGAINLTNTPDSSNVVFTEIIDLDQMSEVEFRVPYQQALPFLLNYNVTNGPNWNIGAAPSFVHQSAFDNGTLTLRVLTALTAPVGTSNVPIQVFVRGAENLEFANPRNLPPGFSNFAVQSDTITTPAISTTLGSPSHVDDNQYLVNFGEKISSLRQVLRRTSLVSVSTTPTDATKDYWIVQKSFTRIPPFYGYDTAGGIHTAKGLVTPANTYKFNFVNNHPLNWVLPAFVGYRGSTNWTFNVVGPNPVPHAKVTRTNLGSYNQSVSAVDGYTGYSFAKGSPSADAYGFLKSVDAGAAGMALTSQFTNAGLAVQCPMYTNYKFCGTSPAQATVPTTSDNEYADMFSLEVVLNNKVGPTNAGAAIWSYCGIGVDFNPLFFLNVPTLTFISTSFTPV